MRVDQLIAELSKFPSDFNARAYEGEVCGIIIEDDNVDSVAVIEAHETDDYSCEIFKARYHK